MKDGKRGEGKKKVSIPIGWVKVEGYRTGVDGTEAQVEVVAGPHSLLVLSSVSGAQSADSRSVRSAGPVQSC